MLELGANVNHADVHNTTPLMDLVSLGDEERVLSELARLERSGRYCARYSIQFKQTLLGYNDYDTQIYAAVNSLFSDTKKKPQSLSQEQNT